MLLGLVCAGLAAIGYGAATVLQALGVRQLADVPAGASWQRRIVAGRLFVAGLGLDLLGFVVSIVALRRLPLFLVESAIASSVAVTAVLAVLLLDARLSRIEVSALGVTLAGLVLLAVSARPGPGERVGSTAGWLLLGSALVVGLAVLAGVRDRRSGRGALVLATSAGLAFGVVGIAARVLEPADPWWHTAADPVLWALVAQGVLGTVAFGFALHRGRTTTVAAITFTAETVFPAVVGLTVLGDAIRPGLVPVAALGFIATLAGSIALAGYAEPPAPGGSADVAQGAHHGGHQA